MVSTKKKINRLDWQGVMGHAAWYLEGIVKEGPSEEGASQLESGWQEAPNQMKVWGN